MHCSSVEQSGQNDARRFHRWLEHGRKAHLQQILSSSHAGAARQAHAKAASVCSLVAVTSGTLWNHFGGGRARVAGASLPPCIVPTALSIAGSSSAPAWMTTEARWMTSSAMSAQPRRRRHQP